VLAAAATAAATYGTDRLSRWVGTRSAMIVVLAPLVGLLVNTAVRHYAGRRAGPASIDAYIAAYHGHPVADRPSAARVAGGVATVGLGAALDSSGLAGVLGTWIGARARRLAGWTGPDLIVVGAAAGFGAALHSPVAAGIIAVEIPFREGGNWRRLPLALMGSVAGYAARGAIDGYRLPWRTHIGVVGVRDVVLILVMALIAGFVSRAVARVSTGAQSGLGPVFAREWHHVLSGGALLIGLGLISQAGFGRLHPVAFGPGTMSLGWAATASAGGLCALVAVRATATGASVLGRGTGGLIVPLLVLGFVAGLALGKGFHGNVALLSIVGAATLVAAGYRIPVAALVWLAESTHSITAVALGGVVILVAYRVGAGHSVSTAQLTRSAPTPAGGADGPNVAS